MEVLYTGPRKSPAASELGAEWVEQGELLERSHVVSVHCPLTPETHHLIDRAALERMRDDAILVNTARGAILDEEAVAMALESGTIAAAGLDVFEAEPRVSERLRACPSAVLAPHIGSATRSTRRAMGETCARAVRAALEGRRPEVLVNAEVWEERG